MKAPYAVLVLAAQLISGQVDAGVPLTLTIIQALVLGVLINAGTEWVPCKSWYRSFVKGKMRLSWRKGTEPARSLPPNFDAIKLLYIQRFVWVILFYGIVAQMCFNLDETGCVLFPMPDHGWSYKGQKDAVLFGLDEKRQFTATPVINAAGELFEHTQLIWQGLTKQCEPHPNIKELHDDYLTHTHTKSHWSTPSTVEAIIDDIYNTSVAPHYKNNSVPGKDPHWVVLLDVYWSHRDKGLRERLKTKYPFLILLFVPASCTSELQPLDVDFNGAWKKWIKSFAALWVSNFVATQLQDGVPATEIRVPHTKSALVGPFCDWLARACAKAADETEMIKRAWRKAGLLVAWEAGAARDAIREEAQVLHATEKLWVFPPGAKDDSTVLPRVAQVEVLLPGVADTAAAAVRVAVAAAAVGARAPPLVRGGAQERVAAALSRNESAIVRMSEACRNGMTGTTAAEQVAAVLRAQEQLAEAEGELEVDGLEENGAYGDDHEDIIVPDDIMSGNNDDEVEDSGEDNEGDDYDEADEDEDDGPLLDRSICDAII
jgi:hypothetical protein